MSDELARELFLEIYGTLPRAGPGGDEHTRRALSLIPGPSPSTILDLGCGPGAQTLALAAAVPDADVTAVDLLPSMVDEARSRVADAGLQGRVQVLEGDMMQPPVHPGGWDLLWSEGAIYNVGVTEALRAWTPLLGERGHAAFTEVAWLTESPPMEVRDWWIEQYPGITTIGGIEAKITEAGWASLDRFVLPTAAWWDEYYSPMRARIDEVERRMPDDPSAAAVVHMARAEIDMFERFSDSYSYVFFVVAPV